MAELISRAPKEDIDHLLSALGKHKSTSLRNGFGAKQSVGIDKAWTPIRRNRFVAWCVDLGLLPEDGRYVVPDQAFARKLRAALEKTLENAGATSPRPTADSAATANDGADASPQRAAALGVLKDDGDSDMARSEAPPSEGMPKNEGMARILCRAKSLTALPIQGTASEMPRRSGRIVSLGSRGGASSPITKLTPQRRSSSDLDHYYTDAFGGSGGDKGDPYEEPSLDTSTGSGGHHRDRSWLGPLPSDMTAEGAHARSGRRVRSRTMSTDGTGEWDTASSGGSSTRSSVDRTTSWDSSHESYSPRLPDEALCMPVFEQLPGETGLIRSQSCDKALTHTTRALGLLRTYSGEDPGESASQKPPILARVDSLKGLTGQMQGMVLFSGKGRATRRMRNKAGTYGLRSGVGRPGRASPETEDDGTGGEEEDAEGDKTEELAAAKRSSSNELVLPLGSIPEPEFSPPKELDCALPPKTKAPPEPEFSPPKLRAKAEQRSLPGEVEGTDASTQDTVPDEEQDVSGFHSCEEEDAARDEEEKLWGKNASNEAGASFDSEDTPADTSNVSNNSSENGAFLRRRAGNSMGGSSFGIGRPSVGSIASPPGLPGRRSVGVPPPTPPTAGAEGSAEARDRQSFGLPGAPSDGPDPYAEAMMGGSFGLGRRGNRNARRGSGAGLNAPRLPLFQAMGPSGGGGGGCGTGVSGGGDGPPVGGGAGWVVGQAHRAGLPEGSHQQDESWGAGCDQLAEHQFDDGPSNRRESFGMTRHRAQAAAATPIPAGGWGAAATPQQTPQQQQGWGSHPEYGDWGGSETLAEKSPGMLQALKALFQRQVATMKAKGQYSPSNYSGEAEGGRGGVGRGGGGAGRGGGAGSGGACAGSCTPVAGNLHAGMGPVSTPGAPGTAGMPLTFGTGGGSRVRMPPLNMGFQDECGQSPSPAALTAAGAGRLRMPAHPSPLRHNHLGEALASVSPPTQGGDHGLNGGGGGGGAGLDAGPGSASKKALRRRVRSLAKLRRVSVGLSHRKSLAPRTSLGGLDMVAQPCFASAYPASAAAALPAGPPGDGEDAGGLGASTPARPAKAAVPAGLAASSFFAGVHLVGGIAQGRFESGLPAVSEAPLHAPRVVGAELTHTGLLKLSVRHPRTGAVKLARLFTARGACQVLRASPTGLLVSDGQLVGGGGAARAGSKAKCYYLRQELYQFTGLLESLAPVIAATAAAAAAAAASGNGSDLAGLPPCGASPAASGNTHASSGLTPVMDALGIFSPLRCGGVAGSSGHLGAAEEEDEEEEPSGLVMEEEPSGFSVGDELSMEGDAVAEEPEDEEDCPATQPDEDTDVDTDADTDDEGLPAGARVCAGDLSVNTLAALLRFLDVPTLLQHVVPVSRLWSTAVVHAHATLVARAAVSEDKPSTATTNGLPPPPSGLGGGRGGGGGLVRMRSMRAPGDLASVTSKGGAVPIKPWSMLCDRMPWGAFLSEGAYKKVYRVVNAKVKPAARCRGGPGLQQRSPPPQLAWVEEAVSVMDVAGIVEAGAGTVVQQELKVSLLVSALVRRGECPNFVETYGVFGADYAPPAELWGSDVQRRPRGPRPPPYQPLPAAKEALANPVVMDAHHSREVARLLEHRGARPRAPRKGAAGTGRHQYIRMELCDQGDLEEFIHAQPGELVAEAALRPLAFQMFFALYAAQREFTMRHYDVKLLNFLLKKMEPRGGGNGGKGSSRGQRRSARSGRGSGGGGDDGGVSVCYGVAQQRFVLHFPAEEAQTAPSSRLWVKLGDYGTADVDDSTEGLPIGLEQFTTLENCPIEQLILGTGARQAFAADMWGLGLSLLHLFTGHAPYEEVLEHVRCPPELRTALEDVWCDPALESVYGVVAEAAGEDMEDDDGDDEAQTDGPAALMAGGEFKLDRTLADTMYRYLVLFGLPSLEAFRQVTDWKDNPVWRAVLSHLSESELPVELRGGRRSRSRQQRVMAKQLTAAFEEHRAQWSLEHGNEAIMASARALLESTGGMELLCAMTSFDAAARPTMYDALKSDLFAPLRESDAAVAKDCDHQFLKYL